MAKKSKAIRLIIKMKSTESDYVYYTQKNRRNNTTRLELRKYDPTLRRHVVFREDR